MDYDILVVGSGIGGMESALKLGDMGYKVLLVEKEPSVGGKMILLSKVFPTLDCASCISTPKMAASTHHPNVQVMVYTEVEQIKRDQGGKFKVGVRKKPSFVNHSLCTGCRQCEMACSVAVPDQYNFDLVARRAVYIAFPQAVPKKAVIERHGTSPCTFACPAGIKAHGYVSLIRNGRYDEAFELILETTPLAGSLGRACYAPCEGECTRGGLEGPLPVRRLKRFAADRYYEKHADISCRLPEPISKRVAVIGSGPAGLTAAFHLAKKGYAVEILEKDAEAGGMLKTAIPSYRLPKGVVDRDIRNVTGLGVTIKTGVCVENLDELKENGFNAIFVACGTSGARDMQIEGEDLEGVVKSLDFLREVNLGRGRDLSGRKVIVTGGGNVAIDCARAALRLGAAGVLVQYRRSRNQMPAHDWEIEAAEKEGVEFQFLTVPRSFKGENGRVSAAVCLKTELGPPDPRGREMAVPVKGSEHTVPVDLVITAVGLVPKTAHFGDTLALNPDGTIRADAETLQTSVPHVFAGGDVVTGPSSIARAVGQGRRAAFYIDRFLRGEELSGEVFDLRLAACDRGEVLARQKSYRTAVPVGQKEIAAVAAEFSEVEPPLTEEEARYSAGRCLDCGVCSECRQCASVCPANAINMNMREEKEEVEVGSVIVSTGFKLFPAAQKPQYGYGKFKNVITGMQMDRLLAPTRPYNAVLRPSDGKIPDSIAYVLCAGSRDQQVGNSLCSRVCCMYSIKQTQLIMGAVPLADVFVYYIDIRAFGKGYEEFYSQTRDMGVNFIKGRIAEIEETGSGNLILAYEDIDNGGKISRAEHDLVVLSTGLLPRADVCGLFAGETLPVDDYYYIKEVDEDLHPGKTGIDGVFVAGSASGAKDIPDSILHAGAAAAQAAAYVERIRMNK